MRATFSLTRIQRIANKLDVMEVALIVAMY